MFDLGKIALQQQDFENVAKYYSESYQIALKLGDLQGIVYVGFELGKLLCEVGDTETGLTILARSQQGAEKMGLTEKTAQITELIAKYSKQN